MAKVRIGFSTAFELENELVGIGTDNPTNTLQALGNIKSSDAKVIGVSTLTTYQGFVDTKAAISGAAGAKSGSTSGEIIIEGSVVVSSGTTFTSGPEKLTVTDDFTLPGISDDKPSVGTTRFNEYLGALEFYTGSEWRAVNSYVDMGSRGRAVFGGGSPSMATMGYVQIMTKGNAMAFGDLTYALGNVAGKVSDGKRGCFAGGGNPHTDTINYITIASEGDGVDFGNLTTATYGMGGHSSSTRGIWAGGNVPAGQINTIQYVEIQTTGNALDFGDLTRAVTAYDCACGSPIRMLHAGGKPSAYEEDIDYWTIASKGNAVDFGDLTVAKNNTTGVSNTVRGVWCRGEYADGDNVVTTDFVIIASTGNAVNFGEMMDGRYAAGASNQIRGVICGGYKSPGANNNNIQYITIPTTGNGVDFGLDLIGRYSHSGLSDSHGGLGGF